jgi:transcriptional regulator with XRE-family HTH domain
MSQNGRTTMSGREFRKIRAHLGLSMDDFAIELGYEGNENGNENTIARFETGKRPVPLAVAKLAWMMQKHGIPEWPEYLEAEPAKGEQP